MNATLPLARMTTAEKLQAMEQLWEDLCRDERQVASPAWHGEVLAAREARVARGEGRFSDCEQARSHIRRQAVSASH